MNKTTNEMRLSISHGNIKMGHISSVSVPPILTCPHDAPCFKECYARRMLNYRPTCKGAYENNFEIYKADFDFYMNSVKEAARNQRFFRWHVSGDIVDRPYFDGMVQIALELRTTQFLCFTKKYAIVNEWLAAHGELPGNLHIIFSAWKDYPMENPFSIPVCQVIEKNETPEESWVLCGGNCTECANVCGGCWGLKTGDTVCIYKH